MGFRSKVRSAPKAVARLSLMGVVAGLMMLSACSREQTPNVLLVTFDTTRYDRLGCTGDEKARTPVVDALAERGLLFDRAYAAVALTLPAHTTMMTGLSPTGHGVHNNGRFRVPDDVTTLAEILKEESFSTAAFVSAFVLDSRFNLNQGFDIYSAKTRGSSDPLDMTVPQRPGEETTDEALAWLESHGAGDEPFFLWVHYYDPHHPLDVPPPFDEMPDVYAAEIAYADTQLGRLLSGIERASPERETLIAFTADHGEGLGQHGEGTHGLLAYDSTLHVPLILAGPGVERGDRSRILASHEDLLPTILSALRLPVPEGLPGRDLLHAAAVEDAEGDPQVRYFESRGPHEDLGWAALAGLRTRQWKYTAMPEPVELYEIATDPRELIDLAEARPEIVSELATRFDGYLEEHSRQEIGDERMQLDLEEAQQLAALGYVDIGPLEPGTDPADPRRFIGVYGWVGMGRTLAMQGRYTRAIDVLETIVESRSVRGLALRTLAPVYAQAGRFEDAIRAYRQYIEFTGATEARIGLVDALLRADRGDEALKTLDEIETPSTKIAIRRAHILAQLGRSKEAYEGIDAAYPNPEDRREWRRARAVLNFVEMAPSERIEADLRSLMEEAPDDPVLQSGLGFYLASWGRIDQREEALSLLRSAAEAEPLDAKFLSNLGWGLYRTGQKEEARPVLEQVLELDRLRQRDRMRLAHVLADLGQPEEALRMLRIAITVRPAEPWSESARKFAGELESLIAESEEKPGARS
jgi:arylsulfatase A-like enzyme/Flp pilus assembly protein TadD